MSLHQERNVDFVVDLRFSSLGRFVIRGHERRRKEYPKIRTYPPNEIFSHDHLLLV